MKALRAMSEGLNLISLLPPSFRDVWQEWDQRDLQAQEDAANKLRSARMEFITPLAAELQGSRKVESKVNNAEPDAPENYIRDKLSQRHGTENPDLFASEMRKRIESKQYMSLMNSARAQLPVFLSKDTIVDTIKANQVVIISGETG
jgi:HrpA-like RNA helicase